MLDLPPEKFLPIQSMDLHQETKLTFNLYVNLPLNQKFILYCRAGSVVDSEKIGQFVQSENSNLFIEKKDYMEFVKYVALRMKSLMGNQDSEINRKMMAVTAKSMLVSTLNQSDPIIARAMMSNLSDISRLIIEGVLESSGIGSRKLFYRLLALAEKGSDFQKHPVNVASLATLITFGIGYANQKMLADIAMAALLHDVGLSSLPKSIISLSHDPTQLSLEEREWLFKHPHFSVQILEEKEVPLSEVAKLIIRQHHEQYNGKGYPLGLKGFEINEMSQILHVADEIDVLVSRFYESPEDLMMRVRNLFDQFHQNKVVEPTLLERIRRILI